MKVRFDENKAAKANQLHNYRHWFGTVGLPPTPVFTIKEEDWRGNAVVINFTSDRGSKYNLNKRYFNPTLAKPLKDWL